MIEWWITPKHARAPISVIEQVKPGGEVVSVRQSHFVDCPFREDFRKKKKKSKPAAAKPEQRRIF
jgi:hypothetical protein